MNRVRERTSAGPPVTLVRIDRYRNGSANHRDFLKHSTSSVTWIEGMGENLRGMLNIFGWWVFTRDKLSMRMED